MEDRIYGNMNLMYGDCLERMKEIPDSSIDMILCDLPYGTSACKWDCVIPFDLLWNEYKRLIRQNGAIVLFGSEPFSSLLRTSNLNMYKYDWKWEKSSGANFLNFKYQPAKVHEDIMIFGYGAVSYSKNGNMIYNPQMEKGIPYTCKSGKQKENYSNSTVRSPIEQVITKNDGERYPRSIQKFISDKNKQHQTQKPVALLEYLIKTYTDEGMLVLDNCAGSMSTVIAALNTKRNCIAIEKDTKYFEIGKERVTNHIKTNHIQN